MALAPHMNAYISKLEHTLRDGVRLGYYSAKNGLDFIVVEEDERLCHVHHSNLTL